MPLSLGICALAAATALLKQKPFISYAAIFAGLCAALISFGAQIAPAMARQAPAIEYIHIFKEHPEARLAMHSDFAQTVDWFDFALFETGRAPDELKGNDDLAAFLEKPGKALVIVPESRFKQLPHDTHFRARTLERRLYMDKKVDLLLLIKKGGKLTGKEPLLLVSN
jgi:hypothetical protein